MTTLKAHFKAFIAMICVFCVVAPLIAGGYYVVLYPLYVLSGQADVTLDQLLYLPTLSALSFVLLPGLLLAPYILGGIPAFITCVLSFAVYLVQGYVRGWLVCLFAVLACALPFGFDGHATSTNLITRPMFVLSGLLATLTIWRWRGLFGVKEIIK